MRETVYICPTCERRITVAYPDDGGRAPSAPACPRCKGTMEPKR